MLVPGATTSMPAPRPEKLAMTSFASLAPTAKTPGSEAGYAMLLATLPDPATTRRPAATALATAASTRAD
jgi:hypothetical protein